MTIRELQFLVKEGEHGTLEFKKKVAHPEKIIKEIVAFANTSGGNLLIGINDDGHISGLKFPEEDAYVLNRAIQKYCKPKINFTHEFIALSDKKAVIRYYIQESKQKPHFVLEQIKEEEGNKPIKTQKKSASHKPFLKKTYVRVEDRSIQASREVREILRRRKLKHDIRFNWGEKEQTLLRYLHEHNRITLRKFAQEAKIPKHVASKTLVTLVLANILEIEPSEREDIFLLKEVKEEGCNKLSINRLSM